MTIDCAVGQGIITCYLSLVDVALLIGVLILAFWIGALVGGVVTKYRGNA